MFLRLQRDCTAWLRNVNVTGFSMSLAEPKQKWKCRYRHRRRRSTPWRRCHGGGPIGDSDRRRTVVWSTPGPAGRTSRLPGVTMFLFSMSILVSGSPQRRSLSAATVSCPCVWKDTCCGRSSRSRPNCHLPSRCQPTQLTSLVATGQQLMWRMLVG